MGESLSIVQNGHVQIKRHLIYAVVTTAFLFAWAPRAQAQSLTVILENDVFVKTDRHYTHGCGIVWTGRTDSISHATGRLTAAAFSLLHALAPTATHRNLSVALQQSVYTPQNIKSKALITADHPYAGATFFTFTFYAKNNDKVTALAVDLGVLGPAAMAAEMQRAVHRLIGSPMPQGWQHQLENEAIINIHLSHRRQWRQSRWRRRIHWTLFSFSQLHFGNLYTGGATGLQLSLSPASVKGSALDWTMLNLAAPHDNTPWQAFFNAETQLILRNAYLDGNLFHASHRVLRHPLLFRMRMGLSSQRRRMQFTLSFTLESKSFEGQPYAHRYGTVAMRFPI